MCQRKRREGINGRTRTKGREDREEGMKRRIGRARQEREGIVGRLGFKRCVVL